MSYSNFTHTLANVSASMHRQFTNTTENDYQKDEIFNIMFENTTFDESNFTNSSFASSEDYSQYVGPWYYIKDSIMILLMVIVCVGVIGNVMVALVILKSKDMKNSTNIFLLNLSIADLLVLLFCSPVALERMESDFLGWNLGKVMCFMQTFNTITVRLASAFTITAVSFERYYAICQPFKAAYICTTTRAVVICALIWFFAALTASPVFGIVVFNHFHLDDGTEYFKCTFYIDLCLVKFFLILVYALMIFIPSGILIILYSFIVKNLKENSVLKTQNSNNTRNTSNIQQRKQVTLMVGAVVLTFLVCFLPVQVVIFAASVNIETLTFMGEDGTYYFSFYAEFMMNAHSAINPILYNLMSTKFRKGFVKLLRINKLRCDKSSLTENRKSTSMIVTSISTVSISNTDTLTDS